jgi:hypothetical protein
MKKMLTGDAALRREARLQQREDRLSIKNADLKAEIERLREALETIQNAHVPDQPASRDIDPAEYIRGHHTSLRRIARAALQPKEGEG